MTLSLRRQAVARPAGRSGSPQRWRVLSLRELGVFYALLLIWLLLSAATIGLGRPLFLQPSNILNVFYQSSLISIMGIAMTVVLITGNFDLSVASVAALSAALFIELSAPWGVWPALVATLAICACIGLLNGAIVELLGINAFIVTLGTLTAIRGLVLIVTDGRSLSVDDPDILLWMNGFEGGSLAARPALCAAGLACLLLAGALGLRRRRLGARADASPADPSPAGPDAALLGSLAFGIALLAMGLSCSAHARLALPVLYVAAMTLATWFVLRFTVVGRRVYAVGGNPEAARLSGIDVRRYRIAGFVFSALAAGFSGVLFASRLGAINPTALQGGELTVIAAAILGGTSLLGGAGSVVKTVVGALVLFSLNSGFNVLNLGANYQGLIEGVVLVAAAAIYTVGSQRRGG